MASRAIIFLFAVCSVLAGAAIAETKSSFSIPQHTRGLKFPYDHGAHPDFQTEWWYYTGQLRLEGESDSAPPSIGFQLTFFRRASLETSSSHDFQQNYLTHVGLSLFGKKLFCSAKKSNGPLLGQAGAAEERLEVWNQDWRAEAFGDQHILSFGLDCDGTAIKLRLRAIPHTPPLLHGENGFSRKGVCSTCASMYYSLPGMTVEGEVFLQNSWRRVKGIAWMDHEFMSSALSLGQVGWDWFSLQWPDGRALMLYKLRDNQGQLSYGAGTYLDEMRQTRTLDAKDFIIEPQRFWTSESSGAKYPVAWKLGVPSEGVELLIQAKMDNQEHVGDSELDIQYWEGAISSSDGAVLGYAELTGYGRPLKQNF